MQPSRDVLRSIWCGGAFALCVAGCASKQVEAKNATAEEPSVETTTASAESETTVQISKALRERCGMPDEPHAAPNFDFDQATLRARGKNVLDDVAVCLTSGPLKGEVITLVGRADPRGSEDYNQALSASRAAAARNYLAQHGVPEAQMKLMARGEQGARGTDESGFAVDRRVDVEVGDVKNSPILQGTMMQQETSDTKAADTRKAGSYADVAEGGEVINDGSPGNSKGSSSGSASGSAKASGSVNATTK
jgi:peptidoglycan-associated lipoprotein